MENNRTGFTLIELIIVIVIVGILAVIAIPRYFANIRKGKRAEAVATLRSIREGLVDYYAVNNAFPGEDSFPIIVVLDGETVLNMDRPESTNFIYYYGAGLTVAEGNGWGADNYMMNIATGEVTTGSIPF